MEKTLRGNTRDLGIIPIFSKGVLNGKRNIRGGGQPPTGAGRRPKRNSISGNGIIPP
jgi:hypothetical protein